MPKPPPPDHRFWKVWEVFTSQHKRVYRLTGGRIGGRMGRAPILVLHHVGRKSGKPRESPLIYVPDGDRWVVVASKGGVDKHPAWFHNVMAAGEATVEVGRERHRVTPRVAEGEERARLWDRAVGVYKPYADYATYTERQIPVGVLERAQA
jgi:F420H(2)-dependent quinone reductase